MATITLKGNPINTTGQLPAVGTIAPDFTMVKSDLSEVSLYSFENEFKILNIFPSIDTPTCQQSVREFNQKATSLGNAVVINLSVDLPFAQSRFCAAEGIENAVTGSVFRSDFMKKYQVEIADGPLKGVCSRAVLVLDADNKVIYSEQVSEIADEPNYETAIKSFM